VVVVARRRDLHHPARLAIVRRVGRGRIDRADLGGGAGAGLVDPRLR